MYTHPPIKKRPAAAAWNNKYLYKQLNDSLCHTIHFSKIWYLLLLYPFLALLLLKIKYTILHHNGIWSIFYIFPWQWINNNLWRLVVILYHLNRLWDLVWHIYNVVPRIYLLYSNTCTCTCKFIWRVQKHFWKLWQITTENGESRHRHLSWVLSYINTKIWTSHICFVRQW